MRKINKIRIFLFSILFFVLGFFVFGDNSIVLAQYWVQDPNDCPSAYQGQECVGENICGIYSSGYVECYDTSSILYPSATSTVETTNTVGTTTGGYFLNCYDVDNLLEAEPYCNNNGDWWCNRDASCSVKNQKTECSPDGGTFDCEGCLSDYLDCDGSGDGDDGNGCELQINTADANHVEQVDCSTTTCETDWLDCNDDGNGGDGTCEVHNGGNCTTANGEAGTIVGCSGTSANCVANVISFQTGTEAKYSTSTPLLWGTQYGSGPLMKLSNNDTATSGVFFIENDGRVGIGTSTDIGTNDMLTVGYDSGSQFIVSDMGNVIAGTWAADIIGVTYGGTGTSTWAINSLVYASATNKLSQILPGTAGQFLNIGASGVPEWSDLASSTNWDAAYDNRITSANAPLSILSNEISISLANAVTDGYLSSSDWNTFNNKWNSLSDMTLSQGYIFVGDGSNNPAATSSLFLNANGQVGLGTQSPSYALDIYGNGNLFHIASSGGDVLTVTDSSIISHVPHSFEGAGNTSMSGDLYFAGTLGSYITSYGELNITAGDVGTDTNLVLKGQGDGVVYIDDAMTVAGTSTMAIWNNIISVEGNVYDQNSQGIQEAIDALPADGGKIFLSAGVYNITGTTTIPSNVWIEGAGASSTILRLANGIDSSVFVNADTSAGNNHIKISNLKIEGNKSNNNFSYGIRFDNVNISKINDVYIFESVDDGIYLNGNNNIIQSNYLKSNGGYGINIISGSENNIIVSNDVRDSGIDNINDNGVNTSFNQPDRIALRTTATSSPVNYSALSVYATTTSSLVDLRQFGTGDILNIFDGKDEVFSILDGGYVGIGTSSPDALLHVGSESPVNIYGQGGTMDGFGQISSFKFIDTGVDYDTFTNYISTMVDALADNTEEHYGLASIVETAASSTFNMGSLYGSHSGVTHKASSTLYLATGARQYVSPVPGAGDITYAYANSGYVETDSGYTGTIGLGRGFYSMTHANGGTITNAQGLNVRMVSGDGTITNAYGVYINDLPATELNYGIYQKGTDDWNYFAGNVGIGTSTPNYKLTVDGGLLYVGGTGTSTIEDNLLVKGNLKIGENSMLLTEDSIVASDGINIDPGDGKKVRFAGSMVMTGSSTRPANPEEGEFFYDQKDKNVYFYNGVKWEAVKESKNAGTFGAAQNTVEVGDRPQSVAMGDINNDGYVDLAVANFNDDNVSILINEKDGTFAAAVNYGAGNGAYSVMIGDINNDGYSDLAVVNMDDNNVSILINEKDGTFATAVNYGAGTSPRSVAMGDINNDGYNDLALANYNSDNVSVLINEKDGTFATAVNYGAGTSSCSVAIGDLNNDGYVDLAVANNYSDNVSVLINEKDGTFATAVNYGAGDGPQSIAIGDLNKDGYADLAVANRNDNNVSVLINDQDGTFATAVNYGVGNMPYSVAMGDINNDGYADLAVAIFDNDNVSILINEKDGTFASAVNYGIGDGPQSVAIGDINNDGYADLAVANDRSDNVSILINEQDGTFVVEINYGVGDMPYSVAMGDINNDGYVDLAVANYNDDNVSILINKQDGTFATAVNYGAGDYPYPLVIGDLNNDGYNDLAVANFWNNTVSILINEQDGTFAVAVNYGAGDGPQSIAIGDINNDGYVDLAVANNRSDNLSILINDQDGTFAVAVNYGAGDGPQSVAMGDINNDGYNDLAVANSSNDNISILINEQDGTFAAAVNYGAGDGPQLVAMGDINNDGYNDLAVANFNDDNVSVLINEQDETFAAAVNYGAGDGPQSVAMGDINNDGYADLAVANRNDNNVSVLINDQDGTFVAEINYGVGDQPYSIAMGDINNDGYNDLAVANYYDDTVSILINQAENIDIKGDLKVIGNTELQSKLTVSAKFIESTGAMMLIQSNKTSLLDFSGSANGTYLGLNADSSFTGNLMDLQVNGNSKMMIDYNGNVGIGTSSPIETLSIQGTAGQDILNIASSTGESLFIIKSNGRIGIGTSSPMGTTTFTIDGSLYAHDIYTSGNTFYMDNKAVLSEGGAKISLYNDGGYSAGFAASSSLTSDLTWTLPTSAGSAGQVLGLDSSNNLTWMNSSGLGAWSHNGSDIYFNTGNVGIGSSSPSSRLVVDGNIIADEPTAGNHVATKNYVDGKEVKQLIQDFVVASGESVTAGDVVAYVDGYLEKNSADYTDDLSSGEEYIYNNANAHYISITSLDSTHFVLVYRDDGNSFYGTAIVGTVTGTTVSYGSEYVYNTANSSYNSVTALDSTHFVVTYTDQGHSGYGTAIVGTVTGTTVSYGSEYVYNSANSSYNSVVALDSTNFIVEYIDGGNGSYGTAIVGTVTGTTISYGSEYVYNSGITNYSSITSLDSTHFIVAYTDQSNSNYGTAIVGTVTGTTISYGSEYVYNSAGTSYNVITFLDSKHFVISYQDNGNNDYGTAIVGTVTGTTISYGSEYVYNIILNTSPVTILDSAHFIITYADNENSNYGTVIASEIQPKGYLGIAQESKIAGESCAVVISGISDIHSGLSSGDLYYDDYGTVIASNTGFQLGLAISETELLIDFEIIASSSIWSEINNNIYYTSGNVGIGTSTPIETLSIQGTAGQDILNIASSTGESLFIIKSNGRIGIGTSSPMGTTTFTIDGSLYAHDIYTSGNTFYMDDKAVLSDGGAKISLYNDGGYSAGFVASSSLTSDLTWTLPTSAGSAGQVLGLDSSNNLTWLDSGEVGLWSQNGLSIYFNTGNVGIGSSSPSSKLVVDGNIIADEPTAGNHVATKNYVDGKEVKQLIQDFVVASGESVTAGDVVAYVDGYLEKNSTNYNTDISIGFKKLYNMANTVHISVATLDSTHFVLAYTDVANGNYGTAIIGTVSGITISYGSEYVYNSGATYYSSVTALDSTNFVVAYQDNGNNNYGTAIVGTVSGTTISYGSEYVYGDSGISYNTPITALDSTHFVVAYQDSGNSDHGTAVVGTVSGTTISYGSKYVYNSGLSYSNSITALDSTHFVLNYRDNVNNNYGTVIVGTVSGTTISYGSEYVYNSELTQYNVITALDSINFVIAYQDGKNINYYGTALIGKIGSNKYIGIAQESKTSGENCSVVISGISDVNSGLSTGTIYYIDEENLTATNTGYQIGFAISETEILINFESTTANQYFGDMIFANNFRITEDWESPQGLIFKNQLGRDILHLDENGNLENYGSLIGNNLQIKSNIGIGTNTPNAKLEIHKPDGQASDTMFQISTSTGTGFKIMGDGTAYSDSSFVGTGADYAEYFYTVDTDLSPGEAVCIDVAHNNAVKRCNRAADGNVMGIVSTKPSIIGNYQDSYKDNKNFVIVGMLGQVPAKVSNENGEIRPGDSLTPASTTSGYVMKANPGDPTVGVALESFLIQKDLDENIASKKPEINFEKKYGEIKVLISRRNKSLTVEMVEKQVTDRIANMEIEDEVQILLTQAIDEYNLASSTAKIVKNQIEDLGADLNVEFDTVNGKLVSMANKIDFLNSKISKIENKLTKLSDFDFQISNKIAVINEQLVGLNISSSTDEKIENGFSLTMDGNIKYVPIENVASTTASSTISSVAVFEIETLEKSEKTAFVVNQKGNGEIADFQDDGVSVVNIAQEGEVTIVGEMMIDGRIMVCSGGFCGTKMDENVDETMGDIGVEGRVVAGAFESICDQGFVWVEGNAKYGTMPGFCISQNEEKLKYASTSQVNISQGEAKLACLEKGYHLTSENEWMTIAENAIQVFENDVDKITDGLQLPSTKIDFSSSSQEKIIQKATSSTIVLKNGNIIYDLIGGAAEWTDQVITKSGLVLPISDNWLEYLEVDDYQGYLIAPPYYYTNQDNGIGRIKTGKNEENLRGFVRGEGALFDLDLSNSPITATSSIGFRCAE